MISLKNNAASFISCFGGINVAGYVQLSFPESSPSCHILHIHPLNDKSHIVSHNDSVYSGINEDYTMIHIYVRFENDDLWEKKRSW